MDVEEVSPLGKIDAPYGKTIEFQHVRYDNDFVMIRLRIKEGKRFTTIDLDPGSASNWLEIMQPWVVEHRPA